MTSPAGKPATIVQKAKRKISLPWFRQGSVAPPHPGIVRQHTIDTPGSFQSRLLRRQPSLSQTGVVEMTWVVADHSAAPGTRELTVTKGQQVEVLENGSSHAGGNDWTLVRLPLAPGQSDPPPEGLVPTSVLKQPPTTSCKTSPSRKAPSSQPNTVGIAQQSVTASEDTETVSAEGNGSTSTSSPGNKRRGFSGRKWLPQPLRKLSQGKVEKSTTTTSVDRPLPLLKKTGSDKRFKLPTGDKSGRAVSEGEEEEEVELDDGETPTFLEQNGGEDGEDDFELPPPMKPITEPILVATGNGPPGSTIPDELPGKRTTERSIKTLDGATTADLAEIEQIVKERMEQHTENQERHSLMRTPARSSTGEDGYSGSGSTSITEEVDPEAAALAKRQFVLRELVETERDYVNDLRQIVEGYMAHMRDPESDVPLPEDLRVGKDKMVFGNLEAIYEWHRDFFLKALERCLERPEELGPLFKRYERKLHMYVVYCQNKPVSEYIVSEYIDTYFEELRVKLGHRLQLCDLLIKPVQRIMKYQLLLRDALRLTERTSRLSEIEDLRAAAHIMRVIPKAANDMMDVGRLQGFDGKITAQGKLLLHGPLLVSELSNVQARGREWQIFLFEQNIIFSEAVGKKTQFTNPAYIYKAHIQVNKMSLEECPEESDKFTIRSTDPLTPGVGFLCSVVDENGPRKQEWCDTITSILQTQHDFLKAIQSPIAYQKELTKYPHRGTTPEPSVTRAAVSIPPTLTVTGSANKERRNGHSRKNQPVQRAHTGGLEGETPRTPSPTKSKLNFLEGFRNTLRARSPVRTNSIPPRDSSASSS